MGKTWAQHIAAHARRWTWLVRIEGLGRYWETAELALGDGTGRETYVSWTPEGIADPTFQELIARLPSFVSQRASQAGGVPELGNVRFSILNRAGAFSSIARTQYPAVTELAQALAAGVVGSSAAVYLRAANVPDDSVIWIGSEALRVTTGGGTTLTASRGYLDTLAPAHPAGTLVHVFPPYLQNRRVEVFVSPQQPSDKNQAKLVGEFVLSGREYDEALIHIDARSQVRSLDGMAPRQAQRFEVQALVGSGGAVLRRTDPFAIGPLANVDHWTDDDRRWLTVRDDDTGEIMDLGYLTLAEGATITRRGRYGTKPGELKVKSTLTRVLVPEDFRSSSTGSTVRDSSWVRDTNLVSVVLQLLTSSADPNDGLLLTNKESGGVNFSGLPSGYGLGWRADRLHWKSWNALRERLEGWDLDAILYGHDPTTGTELLDRLLKIAGIYLASVDGVLRPVLPRVPAAGSTPDLTLDDDRVLVERTGQHAYRSRSRVSQPASAQWGAVLYKVGPKRQPWPFTNADFENTVGQGGVYSTDSNPPLVIEAEWVDPRNPQWLQFPALQRLFKFRAPPNQIDLDTELGALLELFPGATVGATIRNAWDHYAGTLGLEDALCVCQESDPTLNEQAGFVRAVLHTYGATFRVGRIAPSAVIKSHDGAGVLTVERNVFTRDTNASASLPENDAALFDVADLPVRVLNLDGTTLVDGRTVASVTVPGSGDPTIELNDGTGIGSGTLSPRLMLCFDDHANASQADQLDQYVYQADRSNRDIGSGGALPWKYGEP